MDAQGSDKEAKSYLQIIACYRNKKEKFRRAIDENWSQALCDYEGHAEFMNLSRKQKLRFIVLMFKGEGKTFFKNDVKHLAFWPEVGTVPSQGYNSHARSRAIIDEIRGLRLNKFTNDAKQEGEALQNLARCIEKLVLQCLDERNSDGDKRYVLCNAVKACQWADMTISALAGYNKTYKTFLQSQNHGRQDGNRQHRSFVRGSELSNSQAHAVNDANANEVEV